MSPPIRMTARSARRILVAALLAGCAPRALRDDPAAAEVLVEVLPARAEIALDGAALGPGSRAVPAPRSGEHALRVTADGYEPFEQTLHAEELAGARVGAALRPVGLGTGRLVDYDEPGGLALAAAHLAVSGDPREAEEYAARALELDPRAALAHRALGDARVRRGDRRGASASWAEYLRLDPAAPDAAEVMRRMEAASGDATVP